MNSLYVICGKCTKVVLLAHLTQTTLTQISYRCRTAVAYRGKEDVVHTLIIASSKECHDATFQPSKSSFGKYISKIDGCYFVSCQSKGGAVISLLQITINWFIVQSI